MAYNKAGTISSIHNIKISKSMEESKVDISVSTELPPCCLRIYNDEYVLVGTYELHKPSGRRTGSLDIYDDNLKLIHSEPTYGAVLDLKLSPFNNKLVATAHSTGNVMLWKIIDNNDEIGVELITSIQLFEVDVLIASLHFSPLDEKLVCVTNTQGESATFNIENGTSTKVNISAISDAYAKIEKKIYEVQGTNETVVDDIVETFTESHGLECWTAEFGQLAPFENVVFTGGDDSVIMAHDLRSKDNIWINNRIHEAGVVGIKCSSPSFRNSKPTSIITGSYDDHIRSLDLRMLGDSIYPGRNIPAAQVESLNLGGGVWRFSESPVNATQDNDTLMVCCMYDGAKIVSMSSEYDNYFKIDHYLKKGHESMCYGGDWGSNYIMTCSFYDKSLQKWNP